MKEDIKKRDSNLECCRIITMAIIVLNHVVSLGGVYYPKISLNCIVSMVYLLGGKFGTNVFVILGVYFLCDSEFKSIRVVKLWMQTFFYMIVLNIVDIVLFHAKINSIVWIKSFLPILGRSYWFASSYIILLILIPLLNCVYRKLKKKGYLILVGVAVFSVVPTLTFNGNLFDPSKLVHYGFKLLLFGPIWFSFLYLLIKYLKENCKNYRIFHQSKWFYFWIWLACYSVMLITEVVMYSLGLNGNTFAMDNFSTIRDMQSFPCVLGAAAFFLMFKKTDIVYNKKINFVAATTFGIYLLHTHETSITIFWKELFCLDRISLSWYYVPYSLLLLLLIFGVGISIEYARKKIENMIFSNRNFLCRLNALDLKINGERV